jgi:hypothetical protein
MIIDNVFIWFKKNHNKNNQGASNMIFYRNSIEKAGLVRFI